MNERDREPPPGAAPPPAADADEEDADPALARERTDLAWTRSSIAFFALGAAVLKFRPAAAIPVLAIGVLVWLAGRTSHAGNGSAVASRRVLVVTIAVTSAAIVALVLTVIGPSSAGLRP
jgi:uncharacterized membrane protein YidH (DUF202 family)